MLYSVTVLQVYTLFDYCLTVWGNSCKQYLSATQALQNRAARAVTGNFNFESSVSSIVSNLEWMNMKQRLIYFQGILMFKCLLIYLILLPIYPITNLTQQGMSSKII